MDLVFCVVCLSGLWMGVAVVVDEDNIENTTESITTPNSSEIFKKIMSVQCSRKYTLTCLKLDVVRLVDRLGHTPAYHLLPGISLVHDNQTQGSQVLPGHVVTSLAEGNVTSLDVFLTDRVTGYLNSLTLSVKVLDSSTVSGARKLGEHILGNSSNNLETGRKKGGGAALWAAGTMAAVGMAALAAVSGKALMTSMLALMLAAAGALRGGGGGGGHKCGHYIDASARKMALAPMEDRVMYRHGYALDVSPTYGPPSH